MKLRTADLKREIEDLKLLALHHERRIGELEKELLIIKARITMRPPQKEPP